MDTFAGNHPHLASSHCGPMYTMHLVIKIYIGDLERWGWSFVSVKSLMDLVVEGRALVIGRTLYRKRKLLRSGRLKLWFVQGQPRSFVLLGNWF